MRTKYTLPGTITARPSGRYTAVTGQKMDHGTIIVPRRTLGTFDTREEAEAALMGFYLVGNAVPSTEETDESTVLSEYLSRWLMDVIHYQETVGLIVASTRSDYEQVVRNHLVPDLGHLRIGDLGPSRIRTWLRRLRAKGLSDRTTQKVWGVLHRAMEDADLPRNPARLPKKHRPRIKHRRRTIRPTVEEVESFLDHVASCDSMGGKPLATFWRLVASTGMRRSEACGLSWDDVDVDDGRPTVSVRRGLHPMKGGLYVSPPKSEEGTRTIGITERLAADLRDLRASTVGAVPFKVEGADEPLDFVFRWGKSLQPLNPDTATRWFGKEWDHARLRRGVTLHGLRHSHGSALIGLRLPDTQVAARLGHSPQVLRTIYARDLDEAERQDRMREVTTELYG